MGVVVVPPASQGCGESKDVGDPRSSGMLSVSCKNTG